LVQVLLLDELTTYLDPEDQQGVLDAVRASVNGPERVTAIWVRLLTLRPQNLHSEPAYRTLSTQVTHRLEELDFADAATYMEDGRTVRVSSGPDMRAWLEKQAAQCLREAQRQLDRMEW
jgi:ABC-type multidrug transport system ATPase subunit